MGIQFLKMIGIALIGFQISMAVSYAEESQGGASEGKLEIKSNSKEKLRFSGICVSDDGTVVKKLEGVTPQEVQIDLKVHKCKISQEGESKSGLGIRVFHDRQIVFERTKPGEAVSGIEFVIPWGRAKK